MKQFNTFVLTTLSLIGIHVIFPFVVLYAAYTAGDYLADTRQIWKDYLDANRQGEE